VTNIELHCIQKPANSYSCKVNNLADVKRKLLINTLLQFHAIILNELIIIKVPSEYAPGFVSPDRREVHVKAFGGGGTSLSYLNRDVWPNRVWFSHGFVLNVGRVNSITANSSTTL